MENYQQEQEKELEQAKREFETQNMPYGKYTNVAKKMRGFLAIAGEKKSGETNELFREHIPQSVFGISSDEIASDLGIDENELMAKITDGLKIKSVRYQPTKIRVAKIILSEVEKRIAKEKKRVAKIKEKFGCTFYGELVTGIPIDILYHLRGDET